MRERERERTSWINGETYSVVLYKWRRELCVIGDQKGMLGEDLTENFKIRIFHGVCFLYEVG